MFVTVAAKVPREGVPATEVEVVAKKIVVVLSGTDASRVVVFGINPFVDVLVSVVGVTVVKLPTIKAMLNAMRAVFATTRLRIKRASRRLRAVAFVGAHW